MRREHFTEFLGQLAAVRLVHADDATAIVPEGCNVSLVGGPANHQEKRKTLSELFELHYTKKELQTNDRVYWLTERQYKSYQKMFENCTAAGGRHKVCRGHGEQQNSPQVQPCRRTLAGCSHCSIRRLREGVWAQPDSQEESGGGVRRG